MLSSDKISFLPDEIQDRIVSYLPMMEAIRTSILSTRWRRVCHSLSNFDLNMRAFPFRCLHPRSRSTEAFKNFVSQLFALHDDSDINKLKLVLVQDDSDPSLPPLINQWISFSIDHNVREFQISVDVNLEVRDYQIFSREEGLPALIVLPPSLFTCSSLTVIFFGAINLIMPTNIGFPNLKDLTMELVKFVDDSETTRLCRSSPILERLSILSCFWLNSDEFSTLLLPAPNLKVLKLLNVYYDVPLSSMINLQKIWYKGNSPPHFSREDVSSLVEATFIFPSVSWPSNKAPGHWQSQILVGLSNVSKLTLNGWFIEYLSRELELLSRLPTSCSTLKHLVLDLYPSKEQLKVLILLLRSYPSLQTLHICIKRLPMRELNMLLEMLGIPNFVEVRELPTDALLIRLTRVEIDYFEGSEIELDLVRFLLGSATSLEIMNINLTHNRQRRGMPFVNINNDIQMFARVSQHAVISISDNRS